MHGLRAVAFLLAVSIPSVGAAQPKNPKALEHQTRALELYDNGEGDLDAAMLEVEAGYAIEPDPSFLFAMGLIEFHRDNCVAALKHFRGYLQQAESEKGASRAKEFIVQCATKVELPEEEPDPEPYGPADEPLEDPNAESDPSPSKARRPWQQDPAGASLVATGSAALAVGGGLMIGAGVTYKQGKSAGVLHDEYDSLVDKNRAYLISGGVLLGVGAGLLIGGVVRWIQVKRKQEAASNVAVGIRLDRHAAGFNIIGRF